MTETRKLNGALSNDRKSKTCNPQPTEHASSTISLHQSPSLKYHKFFRTHGAIANISIHASSKNPEHIFAFVQYHFPLSLHTFLRDENGKSVKGSRITVFPAKYDKPTPNQPQNHKFQISRPHLPKNPTITKQKNRKSSFRDFRSYREVANPNIKKMNNYNHPNPETKIPDHTQILIKNKVNPQKTKFTEAAQEVTFIKSNPSRHRIMS